MRGNELIARAVTACGGEYVFAMMGAGGAPWIAYGTKGESFKYIGSRHEAAAIMAATGYSRTSDRVGVCSITGGPGLGNAIGAITAATRDNAALVIITNKVDPASVHNPSQIIDHAALIGPTGADFIVLDSADDIQKVIANAFLVAKRESRPQIISFREEILGDEADETMILPPTPPESPPIATEDSIREALRVMEQSERPALLAGRGVVHARAESEVEALAGDLGALLTTSLPTYSLFAGNASMVGFAGGWSKPATRRLLEQADCVVALGASMNHFTTDAGRLFPNATLIHCDSNSAAIGCYTRADVPVLGDVADSVRRLREGVQARGPFPSAQGRFPELGNAPAKGQFYSSEQDLSGPDGLDTRAVFARMDRLLPDDRVVVTDLGRWLAPLPSIVRVQNPRSFAPSLGFASIGHGLGTAVGAALAAPDRLTVLFSGDGGFLMSAQELGMVHRAGIQLLVVLLNDEQFGSDVDSLTRFGLSSAVASFPSPDMTQLARAYGGDGRVIRTTAELNSIRLQDIEEGLYIIDARISPNLSARAFAREHL